MQTAKLTDGRGSSRVESPRWDPPVLEFTIERHGRTVQGSTRAELQRWQLNFDTMAATFVIAGYRVVGETASPLKVDPLAEEVARLAAAGNPDGDLRIKEKPSGIWTVVVGEIPGLDHGFKQTLASRRKRFRSALLPAMRACGFVPDPTAKGSVAGYRFIAAPQQ
jgi:hypothetical protein